MYRAYGRRLGWFARGVRLAMLGNMFVSVGIQAPACSTGTWCSGITSASHAEGPGFKSQCVHLFCIRGTSLQRRIFDGNASVVGNDAKLRSERNEAVHPSAQRTLAACARSLARNGTAMGAVGWARSYGARHSCVCLWQSTFDCLVATAMGTMAANPPTNCVA